MNEIIPSDWVSSQSLIKVIGVGGGGSNAVNHMLQKGISNVDFMICNTDAQALAQSKVVNKLQLGETITRGRGAGCNPDVARMAAEESEDKIRILLGGCTEMVFITAGMGGGTGTGAAPVIARIAKDMDLLTVAVVTLPFRDEGKEFLQRALDGIHELEQNVDSLLIIDNEKLYKVFGDLSIFEAFPRADDVLGTAVKGIAEIITRPGFINVDFADVKMVMKNSGMALMGTGSASGPDRATESVKQAFSSPLLNDADLSKASNVLVNISSSAKKGLTMSELSQIMDYIKEYTGGVANFKRGVVCDDSLDDVISITIVATGFSLHTLPQLSTRSTNRNSVKLEQDPQPSIETEGEILNPVYSSEGIGLGRPTIFTSSNMQEGEYSSRPLTISKNKPALTIGAEGNMTELDKVPAYIRRKKNIYDTAPNQSPLQNSSPLQIRETGQGTQLNCDNSYIHQNQD